MGKFSEITVTALLPPMIAHSSAAIVTQYPTANGTPLFPFISITSLISMLWNSNYEPFFP